MVVLYDCDIVGLPNRLQRFAVIASISLPLAVMMHARPNFGQCSSLRHSRSNLIAS